MAVFCGAGVSANAGYPSFGELVDHIYESIPSHEKTRDEKRALCNWEYDRALHSLECQLSEGSNQVRDAAVERLSRRPQTLAIHRDLIEIAYQSGGVHLVTTNFDLLFVKALKQLRRTRKEFKGTDIDTAPKLLVPKSFKWNSIVHLHGMIDPRLDPRAGRLVLTSADLGAAYLTERWASRFVGELVRRYTILFVGFSAKDTVMRYILDALDADLRVKEHVFRPFAFASFNPAKGRDRELEAWRVKRIEPILYPAVEGDHTALAKCLSVWARDWRAGQEGRSSIVESLSDSRPELPPPDLERFIWALSHESGKPATKLVVTNEKGVREPRAPLDWIGEFEGHGLLSASSTEHENPISDPFIGTQASENGIPISARGWETLRWLVSHQASVGLFQRVARAGGAMHPSAASEFRHGAVDHNLEFGKADLSCAWTLLTSPAISLPRSKEMVHFDVRSVCKVISRWPTEPWVAHEIVFCLTPFLRFKDPTELWKYEAAVGRPEADRRTRDFLLADLVLRCGDSADLLAKTLADKPQLHVLMAGHLPALLQRAIDLFALTGTSSPGGLGWPTVQPVSSDGYQRDWTLLVALSWSVFLACEEHAPSTALDLFRGWTRSEHVVHRRLALKAAVDSKILDSSDRLSALIGQA